MNYLDALAADAGDDSELLHELAGAYLAIGDVQGDQSTANLNDFRGALASYEKARRLLVRAFELKPQDVGARRALALAYNKIGDAEHALERLEPAQHAYEQALRVIDALAKEIPGDSRVQDDLATTHERLGVMARRFNRLAEAEQHFRTTLRISEQLLAESPEDPSRLRGRATVFTKLAELHYQRGDRETAQRYYERFTETANRLAAADPANMVYRTDQMIGEQWVGIIRLESGDAQGAIDPLRRSIAEARSLLDEDPTVRRARIALTASLTRLGEALLATDQLDEARSTFEELLAATGADHAANPDDLTFARRFAVSHYKLAEYHERLAGSNDAAAPARRDHLQKRLRHLEQCRAVFVELRQRGTLSVGDAGVPEELAAEIDAVRAALAAAASRPATASDTERD
ncbi:MAG: hypothetical protein D6744_18570 [Planctomycetota bacterium]|nr:MAG: hypothetical protein D6744_18570 [Planctomycetota bacterium]